MKNQISKLYNAVSAPVAATRETAALLYERAKQKLGYGQTLKDIVENTAKEDYIGIEDIKHLYLRSKTQTTDNGIEDIKHLYLRSKTQTTDNGIEDNKLIASNEPLMGCGPLPDWLRKKRCIHSLDTFDDNLCVWRCLAIYSQRDVKRGIGICYKRSVKVGT